MLKDERIFDHYGVCSTMYGSDCVKCIEKGTILCCVGYAHYFIESYTLHDLTTWLLTKQFQHPSISLVIRKEILRRSR